MPGPGIPVVQWGTFLDKLGAPHVAPAIEGYLMKGHILSLKCPCGPKLHVEPDSTIIVHEMIH